MLLGLIINLISIRKYSCESKDSLNVKGAYLEVLSDALGSVGVIIAAICDLFHRMGMARYHYCSIDWFLGLPRAWLLLKQSINILLEGVPEEIDIEKLRRDLLALNKGLRVFTN